MNTYTYTDDYRIQGCNELKIALGKLQPSASEYHKENIK